MRAAFALFHSASCSARHQIALGNPVTGEGLSDEATTFAAARPLTPGGRSSRRMVPELSKVKAPSIALESSRTLPGHA